MLPFLHFDSLGVFDHLTFRPTSNEAVWTDQRCGSPGLHLSSIRTDLINAYSIQISRQGEILTSQQGLANPRFEFWKRNSSKQRKSTWNNEQYRCSTNLYNEKPTGRCLCSNILSQSLPLGVELRSSLPGLSTLLTARNISNLFEAHACQRLPIHHTPEFSEAMRGQKVQGVVEEMRGIVDWCGRLM